MFITTSTIFLGKKNFDAYLLSIPVNDNEISKERKIELALESFELYNKGIPYNCRPLCLYYFYHFYPAEHQEEISPDFSEKLDILNYYADRSLRDKKILEYLEQLEPEKYFEVFQLRGKVEAYNSGLEDYLDLLPDLEWVKIQDRVLQFIENEPVCSHYLLEKMLSGLSKYYNDNSIKTSVRYKIAQKIWQCSSDLDMLHSAWLCLNNPEDIFEYKKSILPEAEVIKLLKLEKLEKEIMDSFDDTRPGRFTRKMITRLFADDICLAWLRLIDDNLSLFKNDNYVRGYAEFLRGYVCYAFGHLKRAYKEFLKSYAHQYNQVIVLMYIVEILETLNRYNAAVEYAQRTIQMLGASKEDLVKEECLQKIAKVLRYTNTEPLFVSSLLQSKVKENELKKINMVSCSFAENIESAKKINLEKRIKYGIKLFDQLVDPVRINSMSCNPEELEEIYIALPAAKIEALGLEEIELFNCFVENNEGNILSEITLSMLISYNSHIIARRYFQSSEGVKAIIHEFPNSLACIFITKEIIKELIAAERANDAIKLAFYLTSRLRNYKITGYYKVIEPVRIFLEKNGKYRDESDLISDVKNILKDDDLVRANVDLQKAEERSNQKNYTSKIRNFIAYLIHLGGDYG